MTAKVGHRPVDINNNSKVQPLTPQQFADALDFANALFAEYNKNKAALPSSEKVTPSSKAPSSSTKSTSKKANEVAKEAAPLKKEPKTAKAEPTVPQAVKEVKENIPEDEAKKHEMLKEKLKQYFIDGKPALKVMDEKYPLDNYTWKERIEYLNKLHKEGRTTIIRDKKV